MFGVVLNLVCILTKKSMCPNLYGQWEGRGTSEEEPVGGVSGWGWGARRLDGLSL